MQERGLYRILTGRRRSSCLGLPPGGKAFLVLMRRRASGEILYDLGQIYVLILVGAPS